MMHIIRLACMASTPPPSLPSPLQRHILQVTNPDEVSYAQYFVATPDSLSVVDRQTYLEAYARHYTGGDSSVDVFTIPTDEDVFIPIASACEHCERSLPTHYYPVGNVPLSEGQCTPAELQLIHSIDLRWRSSLRPKQCSGRTDGGLCRYPFPQTLRPQRAPPAHVLPVVDYNINDTLRDS